MLTLGLGFHHCSTVSTSHYLDTINWNSVPNCDRATLILYHGGRGGNLSPVILLNTKQTFQTCSVISIYTSFLITTQSSPKLEKTNHEHDLASLPLIATLCTCVCVCVLWCWAGGFMSADRTSCICCWWENFDVTKCEHRPQTTAGKEGELL